MREDEILVGSLMENSWLTLEQVAAACTVDPQWLLRHIEDGLFPHAESVAGVWCFLEHQSAARTAHAAARTGLRCRPELAALMADLLEELDELRARLGVAG
jgi:chaperone modulatory protein CbpM